MVYLSSCLRGQIQLTGDTCQKLGQAERKGLFKKKTFMSYDMDKGWACVKLNAFQLFVRKIFGSYQSTHLDRVIRGFNRTTKKNCIDDEASKANAADLVRNFDARMHAIWSKKYPKKSFPEIFFDTKNFSFIGTYTESKCLLRHTRNQYNAIEQLTKKEGLNTEEFAQLEKKVKDLVEDLPEFIAFFASSRPELKEKFKNFPTLILENLEKFKNKEIKAPVLEYLILKVFQECIESKKKA